MTRRREKTIHPDRYVRSVEWLVLVLCLGLALGLLVAGLVYLGSARYSTGGGFVGGAAASVVFAYVFWRLMARPGPALSIRVGPDSIELMRHRKVVDRVERPAVAAVVLEAASRAGLQSIRIYAPDQTQVGEWKTNWMGKSSFHVSRAMRRFGYPCAVKNYGMAGASHVRGSAALPPWVEELV